MAEWMARRAIEEEQLNRQVAFAAGESCRSRSERPPRRDYSTAATRDGQAFLISTVGARRPA